jgi:hypothetical protein
MKINPRINKRVNESVTECRRVITNAIIELLKSIDVENGQETYLGKTLFLFQSKGNTTETIICNMIAYEDRSCNPYLIVRHGDTNHSSLFMAIDSLLVIFDAVKAVVRSE